MRVYTICRVFEHDPLEGIEQLKYGCDPAESECETAQSVSYSADTLITIRNCMSV